MAGKVEFEKLATYQTIADIIICPDSKNQYNEITRHIKVYDSLASGKPVIFSYFKYLRKNIEPFQGIEYFEPENIEELAEKIIKVLTFYKDYLDKAISNKEKIKSYTYQNNTKKLIKQLI